MAEHFEIVRAATPPPLLNMSKNNLDTLKVFTPTIPDWLEAASQEQRAEARRLVEDSVSAHTDLTRAMAGIKTSHEFAEPLLKNEIRKKFGLELNVNEVRLYLSGGRDFDHREAQDTTILEAALDNFPSDKKYNKWQYSYPKCFTVGPKGERKDIPLDVSQFTLMCRELDLGKQYQAHISNELKRDEPDAQDKLKDLFVGYQKAALKAASFIALRKGDISVTHYRALMETIRGEKTVRVNGKTIWFRGLSFMEMPLYGCIIFDIADPEDDTFLSELIDVFDSEQKGDFIAYIPDDPDCPVKHYTSIAEFKARLIGQFVRRHVNDLTNAPTSYQQFFSRFVRYKDRAKFYYSFTESVQTSPGGIARRDNIERRQKQKPDFLLQFRILDPSGEIWAQHYDIWTTRFNEFKKRIFDDARSAVVSTRDADAAETSTLVAQLLDIGLTALNLLSFAIPPLGVVMLGVSAVQLMYEVLEGVEDLGKGDKEAGWLHITNVLENIGIGVATLPLLAAIHSQFTPIELPGGQKRLWKPDLSPYRSNVSLEGIEPNVRGQYRIADKLYVRIDGHVFEKRFDVLTGKWRIRHPTNTEAFQPFLKENGDSGWSLSLERPLNKSSTQLPAATTGKETVQNNGVLLAGESDVAPPHPLPVFPKGVSNVTHGQYAVEESLILGLSPVKGIFRSADGQRFYIRNVDETGQAAVYQIRDSFNLNTDIVDVNIVDPRNNAATELRVWQVAPDQWQKISLTGGSTTRNLISAQDLLDCQRMALQAPDIWTLQQFSKDRGLFLPTLRRYVMADGSISAEGLEFLNNKNAPRRGVTAEYLSKWEKLSPRERFEWTREGFANSHRLDVASFMKAVNQDGTLNIAELPSPAFNREQLPSGLWEPLIATDVPQRLRDAPIDWGEVHDGVPFTAEQTDIRQALTVPEFSRVIINTNLFEAGKVRYSASVAKQLAHQQGGGSFIFSMQRMNYSGALKGEFNAIKVVDTEAGELIDQSNAVLGYWAPQGGYVDIPVHPGWGEPDHVFTPGFGGCSLVVDQLGENTLRVRHVEGGKENPQYNTLPADQHGWGLSAAMEYPDYAMDADQDGNLDSRLAGFAFMKYERKTGVWSIHYQSVQGAPNITRYSTARPGLFGTSGSQVTVYERTKVRKTMARQVVTVDKPVDRKPA